MLFISFPGLSLSLSVSRGVGLSCVQGEMPGVKGRRWNGVMSFSGRAGDDFDARARELA